MSRSISEGALIDRRSVRMIVRSCRFRSLQLPHANLLHLALPLWIAYPTVRLTLIEGGELRLCGWRSLVDKLLSQG